MSPPLMSGPQSLGKARRRRIQYNWNALFKNCDCGKCNCPGTKLGEAQNELLGSSAAELG